MHIFTFQNGQLVKLPKLEIPRGIAIKEKTVWLFRLYNSSYLCHLFCVNNEDRLILYNISKAEKTYVEEAFAILGTPGESYAVNTVDNLIMVHNMNTKVTVLFDIKGVPSEHGPSITGLSFGRQLFTVALFCKICRPLGKSKHKRPWICHWRCSDQNSAF